MQDGASSDVSALFSFDHVIPQRSFQHGVGSMAANFRECRMEAGLTLEQIAAEFGVASDVAHEWEIGSLRPPERVLRSLDVLCRFTGSVRFHNTVDILEGTVDARLRRRHQSEVMKPRLMANGDPSGIDVGRSINVANTSTGKKAASDPQRPRLLDLFCCAGGAAVGYYRAGFEVVGVDIVNRPRFPYEFIEADAMKLDPDFIASFDAIHASPPCQSYSDLAKRNGNGDEWPRLIEPVREMLINSGLPYVIENVEGAPLLDPVVLCGTMFPSLRVLRHRLFEANFKIVPPPHKKHPKVHTFDKRKSHFGKTNEWTDFVQVTGGGNCRLAAARDAMGIEWMTKGEINEAIPPAYTELIGRQLMAHIKATEAEAEKVLKVA